MDKASKIKIKQLVDRLSRKHGLSAVEIKEIVNSPYKFTHEKLSVLNLEDVEGEDEVKSLKTNFNYKALGKLYLSYPAFVARKNRKKNASKINNRKWKK